MGGGGRRETKKKKKKKKKEKTMWDDWPREGQRGAQRDRSDRA
jgi:hypothetical protein